MPFLHKKKIKGEVYLSVCESIREGDKVKQKHLHSLGKLSDYSEKSLTLIARNLHLLAEGSLDNFQDNNCEEQGRYNYGFPLIIKYLLRLFGFEEWCLSLDKKHKLTYSLFEVLVILLSNRWSSPLSKLGLFETQTDFIGIKKIKLQWLYRSLNYFSTYSDSLQKLIFQQNKKFSGLDVSVAFYDVSTFYFDSELEIEGALRQKGFGKDGKIGQTQVVLGLLLDQFCNPIGYQLYSGDQYEGHTVIDALDKLKKEYKLKKLTFVADTGMLNANNLAQIEAKGYDYLLGDSLKKLPQKTQNILLDNTTKKQLVVEIDGEVHIIYYNVTTYNNRKILCTYSEKRAKKDRIKREEKLKKANELLKNPSTLGNKAKIFFLKAKDGQNYEIDQAKVEKSKLYDGWKAICTNKEDMDEKLMLEQYKQLYKIEQSFRSFKSFLETRPMFHWTDERIKGHFAVCYLSFALLRYLQRIFKKEGLEYCEDKIRRNLNQMQVSHLIQNKEDFYMRAKLEDIHQNYLKTLKINTLKDINDKTLIINYLA